MINIVSNEAFKRLNKINNPKYRDSNTTSFDVLLEGERIISQVIVYGNKIDSVYISSNKINHFESILKLVKCPIYLLSEKQSSILTETKNEQGIYAQLEFKIKPFLKQKRLLYLNNITDPGNLGTIIRTVASFPIDGLLIDEKCCDIANSKVIRASMGAVFKVPILRVNSDWLAQNNHPLIISDAHQGISLKDFPFPTESFVLVIGSEAFGVADTIKTLPHQKVFIPITDEMESLNVAIATGIFLYKMSN